ncbi:MAG: hypothetical protein OXC65_09585 [Thiotrichales bacterium]|nr:hypothetical protein [Thiotrichales bacterium]
MNPQIKHEIRMIEGRFIPAADGAVLRLHAPEDGAILVRLGWIDQIMKADEEP